MKITAVICEYNPFHKGHKLQLDMIGSRGDLAVCIMSGGFVQRGQPALFDKYARAEAAVREGADLVLELPYPYCCSAAEFFAGGGVGVADSLGVVDELCFGSECGSVDALRKVSERLSSAEFAERMKDARADAANKTKPHASLREEVYAGLYGEGFPTTPNDILGVEYISALNRLNSKIVPVTYKREEGYSATEARRLIRDLDDYSAVPDGEYFAGKERYSMELAEQAILFFYRTVTPKQLMGIEGMTNGIAERLTGKAAECTSLAELLEKAGGKGYTQAKLRRCILHGMTGVTSEMLKEPPAYTQALAFNERGRGLLRRIAKEGSIRVITKPAHYKRLDGRALAQAEFSAAAEGLLALMCGTPKAANEFLRKNPYVHTPCGE